jgi:hypothetical protein
MAHSIEKDDKICENEKITANIESVIKTSRRLDSFLYEAAQNFEVFSNIQS